MHVMLDLETLGTQTNACILQIGAVLFEPVSGGKVLNGKGFNLFTKPNQSYGTVSPSTLAWWLQQSNAKTLGKALDNNAVELPDALVAFRDWPFQAHGLSWSAITGIWSNGANFDQPILQSAFETLGITTPWNFRASRCCRTLFNLVGGAPQIDWAGLQTHDAFDDCIGQVMQVQKAMGMIQKG